MMHRPFNSTVRSRLWKNPAILETPLLLMLTTIKLPSYAKDYSKPLQYLFPKLEIHFSSAKTYLKY